MRPVTLLTAVEYRDGQPWRIPIRVDVTLFVTRSIAGIRTSKRYVLDNLTGVIDSGSSSTSVPSAVIDELERRAGEPIPVESSRPATFANGRTSLCSTYDLALRLVDIQGKSWPRSVPLSIPGGIMSIDGSDAILIGLDFLHRASRAAHQRAGPGTSGWFTLEFAG